MLRPIFCALRCAPLFWYYVIKDLGKYIQRKGCDFANVFYKFDKTFSNNRIIAKQH